MPHLLRAFLSVVLGLVVGSALNMALVTAGGKLVTPPAGADLSTMDGLKASMHLFGPQHFVFPFLAHALGTLVGAAVAWLAAGRASTRPGYVVGGVFLLGGIANVLMLPSPGWFSALDLLLAYLPAAWLGQVLARRLWGRAGG